jgi:hypothetical protein
MANEDEVEKAYQRRLRVQRQEEFSNAEVLADKLMSALYRIRAMFPAHSKVWEHIPAAQSELESIKKRIAEAKKELT